jgi:hypothetical protein
MDHVFFGQPPTNPVLRYMAILSAARDFGVSQFDIEQVARRFDPLTVCPRELADALAEMLPDPMPGLTD